MTATATAIAQDRFWIDDPADLGTAAHDNNVIPLGGVRGGTNFYATRWQQLVPARRLPPLRGRFEAMSVMCHMGAAEQEYQTLRIDVAGTRAEALELDLGANLPVPMTVLRAEDRTIGWLGGEPTRLGFDASFPYDGVSGLVLDIHKVIDPGKLAAGPLNMKTTKYDPKVAGRPLTVYAMNTQESGSATVQPHPCALLVRLHFVARERFGARIAVADGNERLVPTVAGRPKAGPPVPAAPPAAGVLLAEAGVAGRGATWRVVRFALSAGPAVRLAGLTADDPAAAHVAAAIGAAGLGLAGVALPRVRELLGTTLGACASQEGPLGGWDRAVTLRLAEVER